MFNETTKTNLASASDDSGAEPKAQLAEHQEKKHAMEILLKQATTVACIKPGDVVKGTVLSREGSKLFIDMGVCGVGVVFGKEFYEAQHIIKNLKPDDAITAKVIELESSIVRGYPELSLKEAGREKLWSDFKDMMRQGTAINLRVKEVNRGGLMLEYSGTMGFLPVSQLSQKNYPRVEGGDKEKIYEELKKFVNRDLKVKILDVEQNENKLIFSEREMDDDALRKSVSKHFVGEEVEGEVTTVAPFGAFIRLTDGLEALAHISEIDWQLVQDTRDVIKVGEKIRAKIIAIEGTKLSLSLKALKEDPWLEFQNIIKKGEIVSGVVVKFNLFGAFVRIVFKASMGESREVQGLVHISEFGNEAKMKEALAIGKIYDFTVNSIDSKEHRMALSLANNKKEDKKAE